MRFPRWAATARAATAPFRLPLLWSVWIVLVLEYLSRGRVGETLNWAVTRFPLFLVSVAVVGCLLMLLTAIFRRPRLAYWAVSGVMLGLAAASGIKMRIMGTPLLPRDLMLAGEAGAVVDKGDLLSLPAFAGLGLFLVISLVWQRFHRTQAPAGRKARLQAVGVALTLLAALGLVTPRVTAMKWDSADNVRRNGLLVAQLQSLSADLLDGDVPAAASLEPFYPSDPAEGGVRPNILLVLSESFWDPTLLPNASFSEDPIPFFHSLQSKYPSGWMTSPEYGGRTANVEWEILTGLSMQFLHQGAFPYGMYMERPMDSLASILSRQGYETTAISPWSHEFFNSDQAYRAMGFARFISIEFMRWDLSGPNIADREVARVIMEQTRATPGPDFVFNNTGENHYPYPADKFGGNSIQVTGLSGEAKTILETFAQGTRAADNMLRQLVEYYGNQPEPTMIIFFGDHLPVLGLEYEVYVQGGWITGKDDPRYQERIYRTPFVVWDNFRNTGHEQIDMGSNFLHEYILKAAGREGGPAAQVLARLPDQITAIPVRDAWAAYGIRESDLQAYMALQHDVIKGEQQTYAQIRDRIIHPNFLLGHGRMVIERAELSDEAEPFLTVIGQNLPARPTIYVGDEPLRTLSAEPGVLRAKLPAELRQGGSQEIEVRVMDKDGKVIARSNRFPLPARP